MEEEDTAWRAQRGSGAVDCTGTFQPTGEAKTSQGSTAYSRTEKRKTEGREEEELPFTGANRNKKDRATRKKIVGAGWSFGTGLQFRTRFYSFRPLRGRRDPVN